MATDELGNHVTLSTGPKTSDLVLQDLINSSPQDWNSGSVT